MERIEYLPNPIEDDMELAKEYQYLYKLVVSPAWDFGWCEAEKEERVISQYEKLSEMDSPISVYRALKEFAESVNYEIDYITNPNA